VSETVRILRLAAGGDGVGRLADGRTVFVPRTAPGDLVTVEVVHTARRFARARAARLVEPSPDRVEPRCPHYTADECGGCQLQHVSPPAQRAARRGFVGDALRRLAGLAVPDPDIEPSQQEYGYRAKLTLAARGRRCIGLRRYDRPDEVFDLAWCHITMGPLMELWQAVREARALLPERIGQVVLRLDRSGGRHLLARVPGSEAWPRAGELARVLESRGVAATLWWEPAGGPPHPVAGHPSDIPPVSVFEQVNPGMGDRVRAWALDQLGPVEGRLVWDLYAGIGETTARLAVAGARVESVELDPRAVAYAEASGIPAHRRVGPAEELVTSLDKPDLVITNPPRTGMDARVVAAIAERRPERVAYISCDPATLARDIARLGGGYRPAAVRCFDLFPQTAHVETVAVLERR
jgi:23S rRNA (uracil1939-C5)-methyltransferase